MRPNTALRRISIVVALLLLPACGVSFGGRFEGTEFFKGLEMEGALFANRELVLALEVSQVYPVPVQVACYYEDREDLTDDERRVAFHERATLIGERVLPAATTAEPGDEAESQTLRFPFSIPSPGVYFAACLTPASPENGIGMEFELRPAVDVVA